MDKTTETSNGSGTTLFGEKNDNDGTLTNGPTWSTDVPGTLPTLLSSNPADNETDVAFDANITLTFSEIVKAGTGNIVLYKESDNSVVQTFNVATDVSGSGTTELSINPSSDLEQGVEYYVLIDSTSYDDSCSHSDDGIRAIADVCIRPADVTNPTLSSSTPADNATGVAIGANIVLNFSESVDAESGNITIKKTSDNSTVETISAVSYTHLTLPTNREV